MCIVRDGKGRLVGILGLHVDDVACGGHGPIWAAAKARLRQRFPFRKWFAREGKFVGSYLTQQDDKSITISQETYAEGLRPIKIPRGVKLTEAVPTRVHTEMRGLQGAGGWIAGQSRPDLAFGVSRWQQSVPTPTWHDVQQLNNVVRRAKQYKELQVHVMYVDPKDMVIIIHSDPSLGSMLRDGTQGGYALGISDKRIMQQKEAQWAPLLWISYRLRRTVGSSMAAEAQTQLDALGLLEWTKSFLLELWECNFRLEHRERWMGGMPSLAVTDAKDVYDHVRGNM